MGKPESTEFLSKTKYALHRRKHGLRGADLEAINKKIAEGLLKLTPEGKLNVAESDRIWPDLVKKKLDAPPRDPKSKETGDSDPDTFARVRIEHERTKAARAKMELEEKMGILVSAKEVELQAYATARNMRDNLNSMAERIAASGAAETDPFKFEVFLKREIASVLQSYVSTASDIVIPDETSEVKKTA